MNMKKLFEQSMWSLLEKKSIRAITVNMLVENVGSCKGTFYKYYLDKFDLCCSCLKNMVYNNIDPTASDFYGITESCLKLFRENESVMRHAFDSDEVNSARHYHEELTAELLYKGVKKNGSEISESAVKICIDSFSSVCTSIAIDWLSSGCKDTVEDVMSYIRAVTPQFIFDLVYGSGGSAFYLTAAEIRRVGIGKRRSGRHDPESVPLKSENSDGGTVTMAVDYINGIGDGRAISVEYTVVT